MKLKLEDDRYCFGCGTLNNYGLRLRFNLNRAKRAITSEFTPRKIHQGFKGIVHGGIIGLILDECMVNLAWKLGIHAVSAEYTIKLVRPAIVGKRLIFSAKIVSERKKMLIIEGRCIDKRMRSIAISSSKCIKIRQIQTL